MVVGISLKGQWMVRIHGKWTVDHEAQTIAACYLTAKGFRY
jgi:hypothetical protein